MFSKLSSGDIFRPVTESMRAAHKMYGKHSGRAAGIGITAGLISPLLYSDDDRGYFRTSLVTTPAVGAAYVTVPYAIRGAKSLVSQLSEFRAAGGFEAIWKNDASKLQQALGRGGKFTAEAGFGTFQDAVEEHIRKAMQSNDMRAKMRMSDQQEKMWYLFRKQERLIERLDNIASTGRYGSRQLSEGMIKKIQDFVYGKRRMLTNAVNRAYLNNLTYQEAGSQVIKQLAESREFEFPGFDALKARMRMKENDQQFLRDVTNNLMRSSRLRMGRAWSPDDVTPALSARVDALTYRDLLKVRNPAVRESLNLLMQQGMVEKGFFRGDDLYGVGLVFKVEEGRKARLNLPLIVDDSGLIHLGQNMNRVGIARKVMFPVQGTIQMMPIDEHLLDLILTTNKFDSEFVDKMSKELSRIASFTGYELEDAASYAEDALNPVTSLDPGVIKMKSMSAVPSELRMWADIGETEAPPKTWGALSHKAKEYYEGLMNEAGMGSFLSESAASKGVRVVGEAERMLPFGITQHTKQNWFLRQAKEAQLDLESVEAAVAAGRFRRFQLTTSGIESLGPGFAPAIESYVGAIDTDAAAFFSGLPDDLDELARRDKRAAIERLHEFARQFMESNPDRLVKRERINELIRFLEGQDDLADYLRTSRVFKGMGEGGYILDDRYKGLRMQETKVYTVDELTMPSDWRPGQEFDDNIVLGISKQNEITAKAKRNVLVSVHRVRESDPRQKGRMVDRFRIETKAVYDVGAGSKPDTLLGKGQVNALLEGEEVSRFRKLLELFTGDKTPENVGAWMLQHYAHADVKITPELALTQALGLIGEMSPEAQAVYAPEINELAKTLGRHGFRMRDDGRVEESTELVKEIFDRGAKNPEGNIGRELLGRRAEDVSKAALTFVRQVGERENVAEELLPATVKARRASLDKGQDLFDFMRKKMLYSAFAVWSSSERNIATETKLTFDLFGMLAQQHNLPMMYELFERADFYRGDPRMAREMLAHLAEGDMLKKGFGRTFTLDMLPKDPERRGQIDLKALALDERFAENFSIELPRAVEVQMGKEKRTIRYLPVLGSKALKGSPNYYDLGEMSPTDAQRALQRALTMLGDDQALSYELANKKRIGYLDLLAKDLVGKHGAFRPDMRDPLALEGFVITRRTVSEKAGRLVENPFDVLINQEMAREMVSHFTEESAQAMGFKSVREYRRAFLRGEAEAYAAVIRHPISTAPMMRVRYKKEAGLATGQVGMGELMRSVFKADDDLDPLYLLPARSKESITHAQRIMDEVERLGSVTSLDDLSEASPQVAQWKMVHMLYGRSEDSSVRTTAEALRSLHDPMEEIEAMLFGKTGIAKSDAVLNVMRNKLAGTYIGQFSNMLTTLQIGLEAHPTLSQDTVSRTLLNELFFNIRQVPISAQKSKMILEGGASGWITQVKRGLLDREKGHLLLQNALVKFAEGAGFETILDEEIISTFGLTGRSVGERVNLFKELAQRESTAQLLKEYISKRPAEVDALAQLITSESKILDTGRILQEFRSSGNILAYTRVGEKAGASASARVLGAINDAIRAAVPRAKEILSKAGPIVGAGLASAAVVGLMTTPVESSVGPELVSSGSQPRTRPEDVGATDHVPGEPVAGSQSSVNPKREIVQDQQAQTRTAVVAPVRRSVTVRARGQGYEPHFSKMGRMIEELSAGSGHTNMTFNRVGGYQDGVSKYVQRRRIREELDRRERY